MEKLLERLRTYPGAHPGEEWKLETDLTKCTKREKEQMTRLGVTIEQFMERGLTRGEVSHILFGWRFAR